MTVGRWSWKLKSFNECVTTHQPNAWALKMDDAKACYLYSANGGKCDAPLSRGVHSLQQRLCV